MIRELLRKACRGEAAAAAPPAQKRRLLPTQRKQISMKVMLSSITETGMQKRSTRTSLRMLRRHWQLE